MISNRSFNLLAFTSYFTGLTFFLLGILGLLDLPGLKVGSFVLLLTPAISLALGERQCLREIHVLVSLLFPLAIANYVYFLRVGYPVGLQDVHLHIDETESLLSGQGFIDFAKAQRVSFSFVGLYIVAWFVSATSGLSVIAVASLFPPIVDLLVVLLVYLVARRIFDVQAATLAIIFFGWDNTTLVFGHEFRTQTLGTLFTMGVILVYLLRRYSDHRQPAFAAAGIIFLFALSTAAFVSNVFAFVLFTALVAIPFLVARQRAILSSAQYGLFVAFFALYIVYITASTYGSPSALVSSIVTLTREAFFASSTSALNVGQEIYGPAVRAFTYCFWSVFGLLFLLLLKWRILRASNTSFPVLGALLATFVAGVSFSIYSSLNPGRAYAVGSILIGMVVALGLVTISRRARGKSKAKVFAICSLFVVMFVVVSVAKFPEYIVGDVAPVRGHELIDDVPYWRLNKQDSSAAQFLQMYAQGRPLRLDVLIAPYMLLALYRQGLLPAGPLPYDGNGGVPHGNASSGQLVLLRNAYEGANYAFRNELPPEAAYGGFSLIYANGDYELFEVRY